MRDVPEHRFLFIAFAGGFLATGIFDLLFAIMAPIATTSTERHSNWLAWSAWHHPSHRYRDKRSCRRDGFIIVVIPSPGMFRNLVCTSNILMKRLTLICLPIEITLCRLMHGQWILISDSRITLLFSHHAVKSCSSKVEVEN